MKKVGIIKLFLPLDFSNEFKQSTGYNEETLLTAKMLQDMGSEITILSANNLSHTKKHVFDFAKTFKDGWIYDTNYNNFDEILVFNSKNSINKNDDLNTQRLFYAEVSKYLYKLQQYTGNITYVITDLFCVDNNFVKLADKVVSQSLINKPYATHYLPIEKLPIFLPSKQTSGMIDKVLYIGNYRPDRVHKFDDYFCKHMHVYGKGYKKKQLEQLVLDVVPVNFTEIDSVMLKYKYALVITDKLYSDNKFQTPRYFECIRRGLVTFVDKTYADACDFEVSSELIVQNKYDLETKLNSMTSNDVLRLRDKQYELIESLKPKVRKQFETVFKYE